MKRLSCDEIPIELVSIAIWTIALGAFAWAAQPEASDRTEETYWAGNGFLNRGLYDLGADQYRRFLKEHGDHAKAPTAKYGLGVCLFRQEKYDDAIGELASLAENSRFEFAAESGLLVGQCYLLKKQPADAATAFERVLREFPAHETADDVTAGLVEALYLAGGTKECATQCGEFVRRFEASPLRDRVDFFWGLAAVESRDDRTAAEILGGIVARSPNGPYAEQAQLLVAQGRHRAAEWKEAEQGYRAVLQRKDGRFTADAMLGLAQVLRSKREFEEAGTVLDEVLSRFPNSPLLVSARLQRGLIWFDLGRFERSFEVLQTVSTNDEALRDDVAYWSAKCQLRLGKSADAATRLRETREKFAESDLLAEVTFDLAVAQIRLERFDEAVETLAEFQRRFPDHALSAEAIRLLATSEHQRGNFETSTAYARSFLEHYPSDSQAPAILFLIAENDFLTRRYAESVEGYRRFLTNDPDAAGRRKATFRLGMALYHQQRFDESEGYLSSVLEDVPAADDFLGAWSARGDIRFQRGEWKAAESDLEKYLSSGMERPLADDALLKLGLCAQRQENYADALRSFDRLLERFAESPHRLHAKFERGQSLLLLGRFDEASAAFEEVLAEDRDGKFTVHAEKHLGAVALNKKDYASAAKRFELAVRADPNSALEADVMLSRGKALLADQRYADAEETFRLFVEKAPRHPKVAEAQAYWAVSLARQNRPADALAMILGLNNGPSGDLGPSLHRALQHERAWCLSKLDRKEEAAAAYRELLAENPTTASDAQAYLELAEILIGVKNHEEALILLKKLKGSIDSAAVSLTAEIKEHCLYRLGTCEFQLDRPAEAANNLEALLRTFPDSAMAASASFLCGESLARLGRYEAAVPHLTRVVNDFPNDASLGPALLRLGDVQATLLRWTSSEKTHGDYLTRFAEGDSWYQAQFGVGWARENQGRLDEAISAYREVVARHQGPTAARAQFQIGECLFARQQYQEAVAELLKVDILYNYPEWSAAALYEAGRCFLKLGKPSEAVKQFSEVVEKYSATKWTAPAQRELAGVTVSEAVPVAGGAKAGSNR